MAARRPGHAAAARGHTAAGCTPATGTAAAQLMDGERLRIEQALADTLAWAIQTAWRRASCVRLLWRVNPGRQRAIV